MRFFASVLLAVTLVLAAAPAALAAGDWLWPVDGEVITPYRNGEDPYAAGMHRGIDIAAPVGTRVVAAAGGTVTWAGVAGSSGITVAVDTGDLTTSYLHLSAVDVRRGEHVVPGDSVGAVGVSGSNRSAEWPHLHFGVRETGSAHAYRDPLDFLGPRVAPRPEPRQPVAAPLAEPEPLAPVAAPPAPAPAPVPQPAARPAPRALPRVRGPVGVPARRHRSPAPRSLPASLRVPVAHPSRLPQHRTQRPEARAPAQGPLPHATHAGRSSATVARHAIATPSHGGSRMPWLAACAGLLLAAGALGITGGRRTASSIGRSCPTTSRRPSTT